MCRENIFQQWRWNTRQLHLFLHGTWLFSYIFQCVWHIALKIGVSDNTLVDWSERLRSFLERTPAWEELCAQVSEKEDILNSACVSHTNLPSSSVYVDSDWGPIKSPIFTYISVRHLETENVLLWSQCKQ